MSCTVQVADGWIPGRPMYRHLTFAIRTTIWSAVIWLRTGDQDFGAVAAGVSGSSFASTPPSRKFV